MVPKMVFLLFLVASFIGELQASANDLRLYPEQEYRQGTAQMLTNDENGPQWATICDKWVHYLGWPNNLCRRLGFPLTDAVAYVKNLENADNNQNRFKVEETTPIGLQSPKQCKASLNITIHECPEKKPKGACDHEYDVFVRCRPKVRCRKDAYVATFTTTTVDGNSKERMSCVPQIYVDGTWGSICDENIPDSYSVLSDAWMSAFCHELGYSEGAVAVQNAVDQFDGYSQELDILVYTPGCNTVSPQIMDQCPSATPHTVCDPSCDYWITCQRPEGYEDPYEADLWQTLHFKDPAVTVKMPEGIIL